MKLCAFRCKILGPQNLFLRSQNQIYWKSTFFLEKLCSEGAVSHNVLYYQQLSVACYQESFYADNCLSNYQ